MDKLQQISVKIGVSPATVLRVLRGENKEVWPSAARRAEEIRNFAKQIGYLPNGSARAVRRGRSNAIALLLSTDSGRSYLPSDLFNAIHDSLDSEGMRLFISKVSDDRLTDSRVLPTILREWACDGLLINYTDHIPQPMLDLIDTFSIPSIWLNSRQAADCVYYDDFGGGMAATQHLLDLGHRRVAYLDFVPHAGAGVAHYSRIDRHAGYVQAMRRAGLDPFPRDRLEGVPAAERLKATVELLKSSERPTAIVTYDAPSRLMYAASLAGLRVPDDLSLVAFANQPIPSSGRRVYGEEFIGRSATAVHIPTESAGVRAVEMLLKKIAAPKQKLPPQVIPLVLGPGDTTGPAVRG